jgi:Retrotransposon gag protein
MGPADTVDSSNQLPTQPTQPTPTTHHSSSPVDSSGMANQGVSLAELANQVKQLMAACNTMQQTFALLVPAGSSVAPVDPAPHQAADPVDAPAKANAVPSLPSPHVKVKVAVPDTFTGNLAKAEEFVNSLYLYFYGNPGMTDDAKITFALSYMKGGTASQWSKRQIQQYSKAGKLPSWETFLSQFKSYFFDTDPKGTAIHKLWLLKQGNSTCEEYIAAFKELMDDTGFNDPALMAEFERGLNVSLANRVQSLPVPPTTLEEYMDWADKLDKAHRKWLERSKLLQAQNQQEPKHAKSLQTPKVANPPRQLPSQVVKPTPNPDVVPMEIDASRRRKGPIVCFRCHQPGHVQKFCTSKVDINAMDYSSMKEHFRRELEEEEAKAKETPASQDKGQDF